MTSDEIRQEKSHLDRRVSDHEPLSVELDIAFWSAQAQLEIAAQLAELNEQAGMAGCELFARAVNLDVEKTAYAIHGGTDFEFGLDQARRMVQLVIKHGVKS